MSARSSGRLLRQGKFAAAALCAAALVVGVARAGDITGTVKLDGQAPAAEPIDMSAVPDCNNLHPDPVNKEDVVANDKGMLKNVVLSIKKDEAPDLPAGEAPKEAAVLDQQGCTYHPHVLALMTGQELMIKNSDPFLHNIHTLSSVNPAFNKAQPSKNDGEKVDSPKAPEVFHVKCDVHPWMSAYMAVFDHPYFAVSDENGKFDIKNVPDGEYTVHAWHEKLGEQDQKVTVKDGKGTIDFSFKPEGAMAPPVNGVILASQTTGAEKQSCPSGGSCCEMPKKAEKVAAAK
jgi:hypothetical protein